MHKNILPETIINNLDVLVIATDTKGNIQTFNKTARKILGYLNDEVISKSIINIFHNSERDTTKTETTSTLIHKNTERQFEIIINNFQSKNFKEHEWSLVCKNKKLFHAYLSITQLDDNNGNIAGYLFLVRKKKENIETQKELNESEIKFKALLEYASMAILIVNQKAEITLINSRTEELFGYSRESLTGKKIETLIPRRFHNNHQSHRDGYINNPHPRGMGIGMDLTGLKKDGTEVPIEVALSYIKTEDNLLILCFISDISERKKAELKQAKLMKELETANKELNDFAYIVSHDLKAPLRAIGSLTSWISTDYADKLDEEGREQMKLLLNRVKRMNGLIDGILEYSRVGRTKEESSEVDFNELVKEVIDILAPPPNIKVIVKDKLPSVKLEATRIQQVFQNLISNAIKYMDKPEGLIEIGCTKENEKWKFSVSDNGPGIEEKYFQKIFQIFQTLVPRDQVESTGIGLTVVKKIVELYGGTIWLESSKDKGTTFYFTLQCNTSAKK